MRAINPHLTLVDALVPRLDVFNLQRPHAVRLGVVGLEPIVRDEGDAVHREDVIVPHSDPGHALVGDLLLLEQGGAQLEGGRGR